MNRLHRISVARSGEFSQFWGNEGPFGKKMGGKYGVGNDLGNFAHFKGNFAKYFLETLFVDAAAKLLAAGKARLLFTHHAYTHVGIPRVPGTRQGVDRGNVESRDAVPSLIIAQVSPEEDGDKSSSHKSETDSKKSETDSKKSQTDSKKSKTDSEKSKTDSEMATPHKKLIEPAKQSTNGVHVNMLNTQGGNSIRVALCKVSYHHIWPLLPPLWHHRSKLERMCSSLL